MTSAPLPDDESQRLEALRTYEILDTGAEQVFDDLTELAAHICGTPIALVSLIDENRQWFKSRVGLEATETPRDIAFCAHAILGPDLFMVGDALEDERFADNPLVTGGPKVRFYAGAPLVDPGGKGLGTLCVIDQVPRELTTAQVAALGALSRQVVSQMQLRKALMEQQEWSAHLLTAKREAEEANRTKSRFLAHMSHELRTPLNAIIGFANVMRKKTTLDERSTTLLERIAANGTHLLALINNVLDLSRIEAEKVEPVRELFDIGTLAGDAATQVDSLIERGGNTLQMIVPDTPIRITSDPTLVRQCLLNLLSNACKFTQNGLIRLTVAAEAMEGEDWVRLEVHDTGIGMSADDLAGVFGEFYRAECPSLGHKEGTGLGLTITRKLCRLLGGDVTADARLHEGSTFTIRLPCDRSADVCEPATVANPMEKVASVAS